MLVVIQPKSDLLRRLFWRDEILELLFWLEGEGLGTELDADLLDRFLGPDGEAAVEHLPRLADEGYLDPSPTTPGSYRLSERGRAESERLFVDRDPLTRPGHGACGDSCWCRRDPVEASACAGAGG